MKGRVVVLKGNEAIFNSDVKIAWRIGVKTLYSPPSCFFFVSLNHLLETLFFAKDRRKEEIISIEIMTIILIPKSDDDSDRQLPIFHQHTSDFDDWWCKSGFADVDKLIFFRRPKKRVRFDEAKNEIWTIDRYDDKENDKLIFFQPSKKRVRFDESANEIWTIDRYDDKENERSGLNIGFFWWWIFPVSWNEDNALKPMMKDLLQLIQIFLSKMRKLILLAHIFPVMKIQGEKFWPGERRS